MAARAQKSLELCDFLVSEGADLEAFDCLLSLSVCEWRTGQGQDQLQEECQEIAASPARSDCARFRARSAKEYLDEYYKEMGAPINCGLGSS